MGYGIPINNFPVTFSGEVKTLEHNKWISRRKARDTQITLGLPFEGTDLPGLQDILLGRGKVVNAHKANILLRGLVDLHRDEYDKAPIGEKKVIAEKIVRVIQKEGGRFLKQSSDTWWRVAEDADAIKKVSSVFRTERSLARRRSTKTLETTTVKRVKTEEACAQVPFCRSNKGIFVFN